MIILEFFHVSYVFCDGYVSALSSAGFGILATIYYKFIIEKYF
jgi:hypothetical protein